MVKTRPCQSTWVAWGSLCSGVVGRWRGATVAVAAAAAARAWCLRRWLGFAATLKVFNTVTQVVRVSYTLWQAAAAAPAQAEQRFVGPAGLRPH
jgi:hypothetical protein